MLDQQRARELLDYNSETGHLTWRVSRGGAARVGAVAGGVGNDGYWRVAIDGKRFPAAHRVIWLIVYGRWPANELDHVNGDRTDNRLCNLREATRHQQMGNSKSRRNSRSGIKGVCWCKRTQQWRADIEVNGRHYFLGYFDRLDDAATAYQKSAVDCFGAFAGSR